MFVWRKKVKLQKKSQTHQVMSHLWNVERRVSIGFHPRSFHPRSFHASFFHPSSFHPRSFHPRSFYPRSFHPKVFHPRSFHPRSFHPRSFHPRSFHQIVDRMLKDNVAEAQYRCLIWRKCFCRKSDLDTQKRIHKGDKPYKCGRCRYLFRVNGNLIRHMRIHTGERPCKCAVCAKTFNRIDSFKDHVLIHQNVRESQNENHHSRAVNVVWFSHGEPRSYVCQTCGKDSTESTLLNLTNWPMKKYTLALSRMMFFRFHHILKQKVVQTLSPFQQWSMTRRM